MHRIAEVGIATQTFLFADLAGFTAMTEAHGDEVAADAVSEFCRGVSGLLPQFDAEQIKSIGDAVMVRVPDASAAIELAVRLIG
jgi:class 3 adenylate cyclase